MNLSDPWGLLALGGLSLYANQTVSLVKAIDAKVVRGFKGCAEKGVPGPGGSTFPERRGQFAHQIPVARNIAEIWSVLTFSTLNHMNNLSIFEIWQRELKRQ